MSFSRVAEVRSERLIEELLSAQGWDIRKPPAGELLAQQEYKDYPSLRDALARCGKAGAGGPGLPEYVLIERGTAEPLAVFEAKARAKDIGLATRDVEIYGNAFMEAGYTPIAIAVAGTQDDRFQVRVLKRRGLLWEDITYEANPISWIPNHEQMERIRRTAGPVELRPAVPPLEVLKARAEEINGLLRESGLKDDFRPAAIGAIMLGLWKSGGAIRRDPKYILADINQACERAFRDAKKPELAKSLHVDEANEKLAIRSRRIAEILERLNITTLTAEHDYLGALYEEFFRYTGGNTIGQYFTPRHITRLMAELTEVDKSDVVLDPACGTGGFLIAAMDRMQRQSKLPRDQIVAIVKSQLTGLEDEPVTAALCVANMILRGDGSTGVIKADCFDDSKFPFDSANVVLMNPPFPHKKTDVPPDKFIDRALEGVKRRGQAAIIVPSSLLVRIDKERWRTSLLRASTLLAVISLPNELFQPYASSTTAILLFEKGVPQSADKPVFFCRIENDGFRLRKGVRVPQPGSQIDGLVDEFRRHGDIAGFCASSPLDGLGNWAPGAYIAAKPLTDAEFRDEVAALMRDKSAFVVRFAPAVSTLLAAVAADELRARPYATAGRRAFKGGSRTGSTIGDFFDVYYGQQELENKDNLSPGKSLVISSSGADNGAYGFFDFPALIKPPFVTVPRTGSIGEAHVQEIPCGATSDCLLLIPKEGTKLELLYVAAATLRVERWRFDYSRKMTPARIVDFPLKLDDALLSWIKQEHEKGTAIEVNVLKAFGQTEATPGEGQLGQQRR